MTRQETRLILENQVKIMEAIDWLLLNIPNATRLRVQIARQIGRTQGIIEMMNMEGDK